jgi:hypothetical protein
MGDRSKDDLRDMSRRRKAKGTRICPVCGYPFVYVLARKRFCTDRCRQRRHRGHLTTRTIRRSAAYLTDGHLSDDDGLGYQN